MGKQDFSRAHSMAPVHETSMAHRTEWPREVRNRYSLGGQRQGSDVFSVFSFFVRRLYK